MGDTKTAEGKAALLAFMKALLSQYVVIVMARGRSQRGAMRGNHVRLGGKVYPFHELYGPLPLPDVEQGKAALEIGPIPCHIWKWTEEYKLLLIAWLNGLQWMEGEVTFI